MSSGKYEHIQTQFLYLPFLHKWMLLYMVLYVHLTNSGDLSKSVYRELMKDNKNYLLYLFYTQSDR